MCKRYILGMGGEFFIFIFNIPERFGCGTFSIPYFSSSWYKIRGNDILRIVRLQSISTLDW